MGRIHCPSCDANVTTAEVEVGYSLVCPACEEPDPEQSAKELLGDEAPEADGAERRESPSD